MTTIDPTATFDINGDTFAPGDVVVVDYRRDGVNDSIEGGIFSGTAELTADAGRTILGAAIVVNYEGDDVIITAAELVRIQRADHFFDGLVAEIAAFSR